MPILSKPGAKRPENPAGYRGTPMPEKRRCLGIVTLEVYQRNKAKYTEDEQKVFEAIFRKMGAL